jgi:hypothetical protein
MKKRSFLSSLMICLCFTVYARPIWRFSAESGVLAYRHQTSRIDPGPDYRGPFVVDNGRNIQLKGGYILAKKHLYLAAGCGFQQFNGINGATISGSIEVLPLSSKLSPIAAIELGYSHLWNQYPGGTGSALGAAYLGVHYQLSRKCSLYFKSGSIGFQRASWTPLILGLRF